MWIVKILVFIGEYPYLVSGMLLLVGGLIRFFWKEFRRPSYREQQEYERFLQGFAPPKDRDHAVLERKTIHPTTEQQDGWRIKTPQPDARVDRRQPDTEE